MSWATWFGGIYIDERNFFAQFAVDPRRYFDIYPEYRLAPEEKDTFRRERTACIVGEKLARKYGFRKGDQITLRGTIFPGTWDFTVCGIARPATPDLDTNWLLFNGEYLNERMGDFGQVGTYVLKLADPDRAGEVARVVDATFANSAAETKTETEKAFQLGFITMLGNIQAVIYAVGTAIVIAIILVSMNTMMMAARERTREIAVLKALGFTDRAVVALVLAESLLITLVGGLLGAGLARAGVRADRLHGGRFLPEFRRDRRHRGAGARDRAVPGRGQRRRAGLERVAPAHRRCAAPYGVNGMGLPIQYNLRNLVVRRAMTLMTAGGIALVVAVLVLTLALAHGFRATLVATGRADNAIILRGGATSEMMSGIPRDAARVDRGRPRRGAQRRRRAAGAGRTGGARQPGPPRRPGRILERHRARRGPARVRVAPGNPAGRGADVPPRSRRGAGRRQARRPFRRLRRRRDAAPGRARLARGGPVRRRRQRLRLRDLGRPRGVPAGVRPPRFLLGDTASGRPGPLRGTRSAARGRPAPAGRGAARATTTTAPRAPGWPT